MHTSFTSNDPLYLADAVSDIMYNSPDAEGFLALIILSERIAQTEPYWRVHRYHSLGYLPYLYEAKGHLEKEEWALACNKLGNVLSYNRCMDDSDLRCADAAMMSNVKDLLERNFQNAVSPQTFCSARDAGCSPIFNFII